MKKHISNKLLTQCGRMREAQEEFPEGAQQAQARLQESQSRFNHTSSEDGQQILALAPGGIRLLSEHVWR